MPEPTRRRNRPAALIALGLAFLLSLAAKQAVAQTDLGLVDPQGLSAPLCLSDPHTLCLNGDRFSVTASFQLSPSGPSILAWAVPLTGDTGYFWFFDETNVELVVKVLNGCEPFNSYWFFAAGLTNLGVDIIVRDMKTGDWKNYANPIGTPFAPIQDTAAFSTCP
jgi:hypothetical protein